MSDYTKTKPIQTNAYPVFANGTTGLLKRTEGLLTPAQLKSRFLKGILERLPAGVKFSDEELKDRINLAINEIELELKAPVFAEQFQRKVPFDYNHYKSFIHLRMELAPLLSIEKLAITAANHQDLFVLPPDWIETANFNTGQINVVPLLAAYGSNTVTGAVANAGIVFLTVIGGLSFVPAYWEVTGTVGICKEPGQVPVAVNTLIGIYATLDILSGIAPNNTNTSVSLSQDGVGQSSSNPGPAIFQVRIAELEARKKTLLGQLRRVFAQKYYIGNI